MRQPTGGWARIDSIQVTGVLGTGLSRTPSFSGFLKTLSNAKGWPGRVSRAAPRERLPKTDCGQRMCATCDGKRFICFSKHKRRFSYCAGFFRTRDRGSSGAAKVRLAHPVKTPNACNTCDNGHRLLKCLEEVETITNTIDELQEIYCKPNGATAFVSTYRSHVMAVGLCRANRRYFPASTRHRIPHCQSKHAGASHAHGGRLWRMRRCDASAGSFARRRLLVAAYGALSRKGSLLLAYSVTLSGLAAELHRHHGRHGVP